MCGFDAASFPRHCIPGTECDRRLGRNRARIEPTKKWEKGQKRHDAADDGQHGGRSEALWRAFQELAESKLTPRGD
jgi:hypothetical protein